MPEVASQTLDLVGRELNTTLAEARSALENYVEQPDNISLLERCKDELHQVQGVLRVLEIYGAALLAEEMEQVASYLLATATERKSQAESLDALMRAMVQLPSYLERVLAGGRDLALVLLPLLNDLRAVRGSALLSEGTLLLLNLKSDKQAQPVAAAPGEPPLTVEQWARRLRSRYQVGLIGWIRGERIEQNLDILAAVAQKLEQIATRQPVFQLWWVIGAVIEALQENGLEGGVSVKRLLGLGDREIRRLYEQGEARYSQSPAIELLNNLLYYVGRAETNGPRVTAVRASFRLAELLPVDEGIEQERENLSAPSVKLMQTVAAAIREDLGKVKDVLDIFVRRGAGQPKELAPQVELLRKIGDTLGVLGLGELRAKVQAETERLEKIVAGSLRADEATLVEIAATLINVEDRLDEGLVGMILPKGGDELSSDQPSEDTEFQQVQAAVLRECILNLARVKEAIAQNVGGTLEPSGLDSWQELMRGLKAGLLMLGKARAVEVIEGVTTQLKRVMQPGVRALPPGFMDRLADAIVSVEYYMETLQAGRSDPWYMLDNAQACVQALEQQQSPAMPSVAPLEPSAFARTVQIGHAASALGDATDPTATAIGAAAPPVSAASRTQKVAALAENADPELVKLFIEEAHEELAKIQRYFPTWDQNPLERESLVTVRRSFHTLKGSGRMVGARDLGEFAWSIENLLNRVLDNTLTRTPAILDVLREAVSALPELIEHLETGRKPRVDATAIASRAHALAAGRTPAPRAAAAIERPEDTSAEPSLGASSVTLTAVNPGRLDSSDAAAASGVGASGAASGAGALAAGADNMRSGTYRSLPDGADPARSASYRAFSSAGTPDSARSGTYRIPPGGVDLARSGSFRGLAPVTTPGAGHAQGESRPAEPTAVASVLAKAGSTTDPSARGADSAAANGNVGVPANGGVGSVANVAGGPRAAAGAHPAANTHGPVGTQAAADTGAAAGANPPAGEIARAAAAPKTAASTDADNVGKPAGLDEVLREIYARETAAHVATIRAYLERETRAPEPHAIPEELYRACHTLSGSSKMAQARHGIRLAEPLDHWLRRMFNSGLGLKNSDLNLLADCMTAMETVATHLDEPTGYFVNHWQLQERISQADKALDQRIADAAHAQTHTPPSAGDSPVEEETDLDEAGDFDPEVAAIFTEEALELIDASEHALTDWRTDPGSAEYRSALKRPLHTLKGGARMAGIMAMGDLSHELETLVMQVDNGSVAADDTVFDVIQASLDELARMRELVANGRRVAPARAMIARIQSFSKPGGAGGSGPGAAAAAGRAVASGAPPGSAGLGSGAAPGRPGAAGAFGTPPGAAPTKPVAFPNPPPSRPSPPANLEPDTVVAKATAEIIQLRQSPSAAPAARFDAPTSGLSAPAPSVPSEVAPPWAAASGSEEAAELDALLAADLGADAGSSDSTDAQGPADATSIEVVEEAWPSDVALPEGWDLSSDEGSSSGEGSVESITLSDSSAGSDELAAFDQGAFGASTSGESAAGESAAGAGASEFAAASQPTAAREFAPGEPTGAGEFASSGAFAAAGEQADADEAAGLGAPATQAEQEWFAREPGASDAAAFFGEPAATTQHMFESAAGGEQATGLESPVDSFAASSYEVAEGGAENDVAAHAASAEAASLDGATSGAATVDAGTSDAATSQAALSDAGWSDVATPGATTFESATSDSGASETHGASVAPVETSMASVWPVADEHSFAVAEPSGSGSPGIELSPPEALPATEAFAAAAVPVATAASLGAADMPFDGAAAPSTASTELAPPVSGSPATPSRTPTPPAPASAPAAGSSSVKSVSINFAKTADSRASEEGLVPPQPVPPGREPVAPAERQEMARVDAELLDQLLNISGEASIARARLEQQLGSIDFNLGELSRTVTRLKEQLRSLEIETEAQILHKHEDEGGGHRSDFDPLELDRYSSIQQYSRALAETANDVASIQQLLENLAKDTQNLLQQQARTITELQNGLMRTRMVPFQRHVQRLARIVRQAASDTGKRAELIVEGASGELDRQVLERMLPPFEHMLRNAVVHGIEKPDERLRRGKPEAGRIVLELHREGAEVMVRLTDDGGGMNLRAIREKGLALGLIQPGQTLSDEDAMQLILEPGFSTAGTITQQAGRGVGMDVVATEIKRLGGALHMETKAGEGTVFTIRLPFTLAISHALVVRTGEEYYALPLPTVEGVLRLSKPEVTAHLGKDASAFDYGGQKYRFQHLATFVGLEPSPLPEQDVTIPVVLVRAGEHSTGLVADELVGSREIVVKSVGPQISSIRGISGATILGDGRIVIILDIGELVRAEWRARAPVPVVPKEKTDKRTFAMVVDDSITVRRVTQRLLERNGMRVITARDGMDAVTLLQDNIPDIILLDIEMPRMDGYEVAAHVRNDPRLRDVPIIMITSRVGEKHRARAIELGVDDYLGKPYQEAQLLDAIAPLVERRRAAMGGHMYAEFG